MIEMTKRNKITVILVISIITCITVFLIFHFNNKNNSSKIVNKYEFIENETNMFMSDVVGNSGDFVYFNDYVTSYYSEYDTLKDKQIQMPVEGLIANYNFYNGDLYCIHADSDNKLSICKMGYKYG